MTEASPEPPPEVPPPTDPNRFEQVVMGLRETPVEAAIKLNDSLAKLAERRADRHGHRAEARDRDVERRRVELLGTAAIGVTVELVGAQHGMDILERTGDLVGSRKPGEVRLFGNEPSDPTRLEEILERLGYPASTSKETTSVNPLPKEGYRTRRIYAPHLLPSTRRGRIMRESAAKGKVMQHLAQGEIGHTHKENASRRYIRRHGDHTHSDPERREAALAESLYSMSLDPSKYEHGLSIRESGRGFSRAGRLRRPHVTVEEIREEALREVGLDPHSIHGEQAYSKYLQLQEAYGRTEEGYLERAEFWSDVVRGTRRDTTAMNQAMQDVRDEVLDSYAAIDPRLQQYVRPTHALSHYDRLEQTERQIDNLEGEWRDRFGNLTPAERRVRGETEMDIRRAEIEAHIDSLRGERARLNGGTGYARLLPNEKRTVDNLRQYFKDRDVDMKAYAVLAGVYDPAALGRNVDRLYERAFANRLAASSRELNQRLARRIALDDGMDMPLGHGPSPRAYLIARLNGPKKKDKDMHYYDQDPPNDFPGIEEGGLIERREREGSLILANPLNPSDAQNVRLIQEAATLLADTERLFWLAGIPSDEIESSSHDQILAAVRAHADSFSVTSMTVEERAALMFRNIKRYTIQKEKVGVSSLADLKAFYDTDPADPAHQDALRRRQAQVDELANIDAQINEITSTLSSLSTKHELPRDRLEAIRQPAREVHQRKRNLHDTRNHIEARRASAERRRSGHHRKATAHYRRATTYQQRADRARAKRTPEEKDEAA